MKHYNRHIAALIVALSATAGLASCESETSRAITSLDDFIEVTTDKEVHVVGTNMTENAKKGDEVSAGVSRKANMYADGNYSIAMEGQNYLGYTYKKEGAASQYLLINTRTKKGKIYEDASALDSTREIVQRQLATDYNKLLGVYDSMKAQVGKSAEELGFDRFSMAYTVAPGGIAGYVTMGYKTLVEENKITETEVNRYLMLDQIDGKWCFTNFAERITEKTTLKSPGKDDLVRTVYTLTDYQVTVSDSFPVLNVSLDNYTVSPSTAKPENIEYDNGVPSTKK